MYLVYKHIDEKMQFDKKLVSEKIQFFNNFKKEYKTINDNNKNVYILLNSLKYLINTKDKYDFNYKLINMNELPENSPYIKAEILFRKIISSLNNNSKISFLLLQLNSGGGKDIISEKTYYKIKMIPLVSIKSHILLKDFSPFFFTYFSKETNNIAFNDPQTHVKSYNEYYLKRKTENVSLCESKLNTVKILFMKFHENSHSKHSGSYKMILSPQFIYKKNLKELNNDFSIPKGLLSGNLKYKNKSYMEKFKLNSNENEDYINDEIFLNEEDEDDEIIGTVTEMKCGESGFAMEYYLSGNYFCSNSIVRFEGNLEMLLDINLYNGESLIELKKIIENIIRIEFNKENCNILTNDALSLNINNLKKIKNDPYKMYTYEDFGIEVNE